MMLVRTPAPVVSESLLGYVLRVSEANGYETPWQILQLADIPQGEMKSAGFPVEKLARVLGMQPDTLSSIAYSTKDKQGIRKFKLLSHCLGASLKYDPFRLSNPALCPECITEQGYIDAFFDLSLAVACPVHKRTVVSKCSACGIPLSLFRPGLLTCKCGASLNVPASIAASPPIVALMAILKAKLEGSPVNVNELGGQLPVNQLIALPLRAMLGNLPNLAKINRPNAEQDMSMIVDGVAEALADWPNGFYRFLNHFEETQQLEAVAYHKRFRRLSELFFKAKAVREEFQWLHDEFIRYGLEHASSSIVHPRMLRGQTHERRFISKSELARRLGISPVTLRKWGEQGLIDMKCVGGSSGNRYIADSDSVVCPPLGAGNGRILMRRDAAAYLNMPVSVLVYLKASGHFPCVNRIKFKDGYHQADLDTFVARLLALSPSVDQTVVGSMATVSLKYALTHLHLHNSIQKAHIVVAYLSGELLSVGRTGATTSDILFRADDINTLAAASRTQAAGGSLNQTESARIIRCDVQAIPALLALGYLEPVNEKERNRVSQLSVERFAHTYISLQNLAKARSSSSKRLKKLCVQRDIPLLLIPRATGINVPFIERRYQELLLVAEAEQPSRSQIQASKARTEHPAVVALRNYLTGIQERGDRLSRYGGQPNKAAIAHACGFSRDMFYDNAEVIALLAAYTIQEAAD